MKKLFILIVASIFFLSLTSQALAGCCSYHGGVSYCDWSVGREVCRDYTYSPTCTCPIGLKTNYPFLSCPVNSTFDSNTFLCHCNSKYVMIGGWPNNYFFSMPSNYYKYLPNYYQVGKNGPIYYYPRYNDTIAQCVID